MLRNLIQKTFDVREGEFRISFYMLSYIFLVIAVLMIIKPTINALFLSELGVEQLPFAFLAVAVTAIGSSFFYSRALTRFPLNRIIKFTIFGSTIVLISFGLLLKFNWVGGWLLYLFYVWVALYAVLSASQFWVLANLVYTVREAKRLFGFIGSGAILGGIFGGYLTSLLAPIIGTDNLIFLAATLLLCCIPLLQKIWNSSIKKLGKQKRPKRMPNAAERPWQLIIKSKHLTYIACIVTVSVLTAKLVDYLFSDFASAAIPDPDELTSFFAFWFSTFNLLSLTIQLFFTHRIVGIWGVGFSLLLLPIGIFAGSMFFFILPELSAVIVIKAMDGVLKQSVHKSASELLSLPLPFDLKNRTKSFIDVVVDSVATGLAGFLLIFVVKGLDLPSYYIAAIIIGLVGVWVFFILKVRQEYYKTFRSNLEELTERNERAAKPMAKKVSVVKGMRNVFRTGSEEQILFMLGKLMEINDKRFQEDVQLLLDHPSTKVRTAAIQNLYFLNTSTMVSNVNPLLKSEDEGLTLATLEYLLLHAEKDSSLVFDRYLDNENNHISNAALYCLAKESRNDEVLKSTYNLHYRIQYQITKVTDGKEEIATLKSLLKTIGAANIPGYFSFVNPYFEDENPEIVASAIFAAGLAKDDCFIPDLISLLPQKKFRKQVIEALLGYGRTMVPLLTKIALERLAPLETCRFIPATLQNFPSQETVRCLFQLIEDSDLSMRLESIRALSEIRKNHSGLKFDKYRIVALIYEECKLHHRTLSAMHTQIIISYRNRTKSKKEISEEELDARTSLLELLERRLDAGLERIFKLLGLRYAQNDIEIAYEGLLSDKQEARTNAIEFLDNLLTGDLKSTLLPIIEESALDTSSDEVLQKIKHKVPTEMECFELLLNGNDLKLKLAVLYLIKHQKDEKYVPLVMKFIKNDDLKLRTFAQEAWEGILNSG
ncbi:ATP:ADP antiporter, AAA family [Pricia antarctica]|uniref:ADP,ATP carrier protein n=1 Tax=Pricia antarctica TaxID=641691 RepID=A0A1G7DHL4_9FLAO|nr:Npt1/Npt2 family nucleotide transporter [Pricia antarctica]SDE51088.1 ATP:ADP antiporter, AAA family [Pricia antarctica]